VADRLPSFSSIEGFGDVFDAWEAAENPSEALRETVLLWLAQCDDEPYVGMKRAPGALNRWWAPIPGMEDAEGNYMLCCYFIFDEERIVRCEKIATARPPFTENPV
jgi:hypothetical protein